MKRFTPYIWGAILLIIIGLVFFPFFMRPSGSRIPGCPSNLKQIALGMIMYSQDYDDKLPPAIFGVKTVGWVNGLQPYIKSYQLFQCPSETNPAQDNPNLPGFSDYWMNRNPTIVDINKLNGDPNKMILMGDGDGGSKESTASYAIDHLPESWRQSEDSPATRHNGGANYAFLDGHVKWVKPNKVSDVTTSQNQGNYTFSVR